MANGWQSNREWRQCAYCGAAPIDPGHDCPGRRASEVPGEQAASDAKDAANRLRYMSARELRQALQASENEKAQAERRRDGMRRLNAKLAQMKRMGL